METPEEHVESGVPPQQGPLPDPRGFARTLASERKRKTLWRALAATLVLVAVAVVLGAMAGYCLHRDLLGQETFTLAVGALGATLLAATGVCLYRYVRAAIAEQDEGS